MKRVVLCVLCLFKLFVSSAQIPNGTTLKGSVKDSVSALPLEYATITILSIDNLKPVTGTVSDKAGNFIVREVPAGTYDLEVEFIGYLPQRIHDLVVNNNNSISELGIIRLAPGSNELKAVVINSQSRLVENKIDKIVYNAEKDLTSQSGVAADVLAKVPQVSVDVDGNVQLAGSSGVRFLINGKPSTTFGSSINDVLQSLPASQIKSIEVITNPGARYDAQGLGGIINIILKTNKSKGYNGNLALTAGTRIENGSFNLNARNNNFGFNAFISGNKRLSAKTPFSSMRLTEDSNVISTLDQQGEVSLERHGIQAGAGFDWTYKTRNNFSASISADEFGNAGDNNLTQDFLPDKSGTLPSILSQINSHNSFSLKNTDVEFTYKRTFTREDQELEIGLNTSREKSNNHLSNEQILLANDSLFYGTKSNNPGESKETEITLDYTQPLKEDVMLGLGGKATLYKINSVSDVYAFKGYLQNYQLDPSLGNDLYYNQKVFALYSEITLPLTKKLQVKAGARYERTQIRSRYSNAQQQVQAPGYNTLVPSVYLLEKIAAGQTLKLSYSRRIERPDYEDLNPFVNTNDPKNLSAGNPYLQPEIGHRIELGYSRDLGKQGLLTLTLFYRLNGQDIQPYITYYSFYTVGDSTYSNVSVNTRQNIGMEKNLGLNLFGDLHITSRFSLRSNVFLFRRHTINTLNSGYNYNSFNYRCNVNATCQINSSMLAEFFGNFNSPRHEAQGTYPSFTTYSFAIRKQLLNKKGSIALSANNFLAKYVTQQTTLNGPGFMQHSIRDVPFRSVSINFSWKFGKLEFKKSKQENESNLNSPGE